MPSKNRIFPLRLPPEQRAELERMAAEAGVSLTRLLLGFGDQAQADARAAEAKAKAIKAAEQELDLNWDEIIELIGTSSLAAKKQNRDHLTRLCKGPGWDVNQLNIERGEINPDPRIGKGRRQIEDEARALFEYHCQHCWDEIIPRTRIEALFEKHIRLEDKLDRLRGTSAGERAERRWADRFSDLKPEDRTAFDDDDDDADDAGNDAQDGQLGDDDDNGLDGDPDDAEGDDFLGDKDEGGGDD